MIPIPDSPGIGGPLPSPSPICRGSGIIPIPIPGSHRGFRALRVCQGTSSRALAGVPQWTLRPLALRSVGLSLSMLLRSLAGCWWGRRCRWPAAVSHATHPQAPTGVLLIFKFLFFLIGVLQLEPGAGGAGGGANSGSLEGTIATASVATDP